MITIGNVTITNRLVGTTSVKAVYKGTTAVWQATISRAEADAIYAAWYATSWYAQYSEDYYSYGFLWEETNEYWYGISYTPTTAMTYIMVNKYTGVLTVE